MRNVQRLLVLFVVPVGLSCFGDTEKGTHPRSEDGPSGSRGTNESFCPEDEPKEGDPCPKGLREENRCSYKSDECEQGGIRYVVTTEYCCFLGTWSVCETKGNCPTAVPPASAIDAPMSVEPDAAAQDAVDAVSADARDDAV